MGGASGDETTYPMGIYSIHRQEVLNKHLHNPHRLDTHMRAPGGGGGVEQDHLRAIFAQSALLDV